MYYLKSFRFFLFVIFFPTVFFSYDSRFDLKKLKKDSVVKEKKIDTVVVNKKRSSVTSFIKSAKDVLGLSFFFERVIPRSWKKVLGFKREVFVNSLTIIVAMINIGFCGYFVSGYYPSAIIRMQSLWPLHNNSPQTLIKPPLVDTIIKPSQPDPIVINQEPVLPVNKPVVDQKPGEFE